MDASLMYIDSMTEAELRDLLKSAQEALDRLVAKRARSTLKEARRMAAEVGFEITFVKTGKLDGQPAKPPSSRAKVLPKYRNPDNPEETWSGRGRQPKWVQAALATGRSLEDLAIPGAVSAAA